MANNLMRFDPFNDIAGFEPLRGLEDFFKDFQVRSALNKLEADPRIKMDVSETDQMYTVKAEIPGFKKEEVKVRVDGNQVTITAQSQREKEDKEGEKIVRRERYFGQQFRSFTLGHDIDESKAVAKYQDGVLELSLPKKIGTNESKLLTIS